MRLMGSSLYVAIGARAFDSKECTILANLNHADAVYWTAAILKTF